MDFRYNYMVFGVPPTSSAAEISKRHFDLRLGSQSWDDVSAQLQTAPLRPYPTAMNLTDPFTMNLSGSRPIFWRPQ